jgi:hypothetical protein
MGSQGKIVALKIYICFSFVSSAMEGKAKTNYIIHFYMSQSRNPIPLIMAMFPSSN